MAAGPYGWPQAKPGGKGGPTSRNVKFTPLVKQSYGKGGPAKPAGATNDAPKSRKPSPLAPKDKK